MAKASTVPISMNKEGEGRLYEVGEHGNLNFLFSTEEFEQEFIEAVPDHTQEALAHAKELWKDLKRELWTLYEAEYQSTYYDSDEELRVDLKKESSQESSIKCLMLNANLI